MRFLLPLLAAPLLSACLMVVPVPLPAPGDGTMARAGFTPTPDPAPPRADAFGASLNAARAQAGLPPLRADSRLVAAAQAHAEDMARNGYFSHRGQDGSSAPARARRAGCGSGHVAENIAAGQRSAAEALQGWMDSSGHRANLLGRSYAIYGLGQSGGRWVAMFADGC